jgi:hypothetical protein
MNEAPVVKYMILCEDARLEEPPPRRLNIYGLMFRLRSEAGTFPVRCPKICALLVLRNGRGTGTGVVSAVHDDTGIVCWRSKPQTLDFGADPLEFRGAYFRGENAIFPAPGAYTLEFRYNGVVLATQSLDVLGSRP